MQDIEVDSELLCSKAKILKALSHPARLCIVKRLLKVDSCNVSDLQTCMEMPQSTVSQHLAKLRNAGIISGERNGVEINYSVVSDDAQGIINVLFE
ncbi:ArsR/SmtB family transcription factor [Acetohalobium arabaticum]|uniref:Transcriptional regulator, ArsR family n=1 Tax=Acetohalobium arabaticum (strain ATCC 49924 / DSM 5501 / Z-7288) TaxID=574087 RepID=D9QT41_ACEAZ|nr:metalloregulator ArsR/SmtB family transcription factor [Acetohalobium arabaticum]ADL13541.1 transcriptional regulator, ArsR family [Acetohalobium arabaticum DSM 5501]